MRRVKAVPFKAWLIRMRARKFKNLGHIACEHARSKSIWRCIGARDRFIDGFKFGKSENWTKNFFLEDFHIVRDSAEHGRSDVAALRTISIRKNSRQASTTSEGKGEGRAVPWFPRVDRPIPILLLPCSLTRCSLESFAFALH